MGEREVRAWKAATDKVQQGGRTGAHQLMWWQVRDTALMGNLDAMLPKGWRWDAEVNRICRMRVRDWQLARERREHEVARVPDLMPGREPWEHDTIVHLLRMGHGLARNYVPEGSMPCDVELLRGFGVTIPEVPATVTVPAPAPGAPHPVRIAWRRQVGAGHSLTYSDVTDVLHEVDAEDAPVVAVLRTPGRDLPLRRHLDGLLRPVLAPGGWDHADVATYLAAAREGAAWGDDPRRPWPAHTPLLPVDFHAAPEPARLGARDARTRDSHVAEVMAGVGPLLVVDGIVHRRCPPPVAVCAMVRMDLPTGIGRDVARLSWRIPGQIDMLDDMSGRRSHPVHKGVLNWHARIARPVWRGDGRPVAVPCVPLEAFGRARLHADLAGDDPPPFEVLDVVAWPSDPGWALDGMADAVDATVRMQPEYLDVDPRTDLVEGLRGAARDLREGRHASFPDLPRDLLFRLHDPFAEAVTADARASTAPVADVEDLSDLHLSP